MAEPYLRQSPLAHLQLLAAGEASEEAEVVMREHAHRTMVTLRGNSEDEGFRSAVSATVGIAPPTEALTAATSGARSILWMGPDEWLVVAPPDQRETLPAKLATALEGQDAAVVEVGESMTVIELSGRRAADVIAKGCTIDLHPSVFQPGRVVRTLLAKAGVIIHQTSPISPDGTPAYEIPVYEVYVHRSFADYAWRWLEDAGLEYGVAIAGG
ncbi:MAG: sarcosine oxidase subunit gamma family protein [Alphaproteobacteria bacterium]